MTREIDSNIQATANCLVQVRQPKKWGVPHGLLHCTPYMTAISLKQDIAAVSAKVPHDALQARHDSIKLFQETMAQLDQLADMVRDFQVSEEHVSALPVQGKLKHSRKLPLDQPPFPPPSPPAKQPSRCLLYAQAPW